MWESGLHLFVVVVVVNHRRADGVDLGEGQAAFAEQYCYQEDHFCRSRQHFRVHLRRAVPLGDRGAERTLEHILGRIRAFRVSQVKVTIREQGIGQMGLGR